MDRKIAMSKVNTFARKYAPELIVGGVVTVVAASAYFLGKSNGSLELDVNFYPKGEAPVSMPRVHIK